MIYDVYNREERALCSHFFRLLPEGLACDPDRSALAAVLDLLTRKGVVLNDGTSLPEIKGIVLQGAKIYTEVAIIRDAYFARKPNI